MARVTLHMAASLDGFIARRDGRVDWLETQDRHEAGAEPTAEEIASFLAGIDCYVMGSRTYETAMSFAEAGHGWAYGDKPTFVLTSRPLPQSRPTVHTVGGELPVLFDRWRRDFDNIWVVGGGIVASQCLNLGLVDELRVSLLPVIIGDGVPFFQSIAKDIRLHLKEAKAYRSGMVALHHEVVK